MLKFKNILYKKIGGVILKQVLQENRKFLVTLLRKTFKSNRTVDEPVVQEYSFVPLMEHSLKSNSLTLSLSFSKGLILYEST